MTVDQILDRLKSLGTEQTKKVLARHGAREPFFGVRIEDLKQLKKQLGTNYELSLELYKTGNSDAMYLAGLIADPRRMTKRDLETWIKQAYWTMLSDSMVAGVAADSPHGYELGKKWIDSNRESIASAGWATLSGVVSTCPNDALDLAEIRSLLKRVEKEIHSAPNRVRYTMNGFVISVGAAVPSLTETALAAARRIGPVHVDMGETSCKVPLATEYIEKIRSMDRIGRKRKTARC